MNRIAVVGGGPGGLMVARFLEQKSQEKLVITLFEATERIGGKILTERFASTPILYEAGVAELYHLLGGPDHLWELVQTLGLKTVRMSGSAVVMDNRILHDMAAVEDHLGKKTLKALRKFHKLCHQARTPRDFYHAQRRQDNEHPLTQRTFESLLAAISDKQARRYLRVAVHSDLATEPHLTTALYGLDNLLIDRPNYCQLYSIEGGIERLPQALQRSLSADIKLNSPVVQIAATRDGKYRVVHRHGSTAQEEEFAAVAIALPVYWLPTIGWSGKRLEAAVARHHAYYHRPAHYLRITILFREPFWRKHINDTYFYLDAFGGCCVYDEGVRHDAGAYGVLSWLLGGSDALVMNNFADSILIEKALASLPLQMSASRELLVEAHVHRWIGTVNAQPGGTPIKGRKKRHFIAPKEFPGLLMVGDYLFDSTINGALESADVATNLMLRYLQTG